MIGNSLENFLVKLLEILYSAMEGTMPSEEYVL
jgi:hypothetical protein